jgi:peptidoglycan hydrolase-like protein with peptidoglycan-binding domain
VVSKLSLMVFLLVVVAGCGLITAEQQAEKIPEKATPTQFVEKPLVESESEVNRDSITGESRNAVVEPARLEARPLTQDEVRRIQARLKASGFDPGPIDGILGPQTKSAFLSLQSSCSELLGGKDLAKNKEWRLTPVNELTVLVEQPALKTFSKEEIQRVQMRLKQSGFDPGPVDGILGPKTNAALLRARAGCSLAKRFPVIDGGSPSGGSGIASTLIRYRKTPTTSRSPGPADSLSHGDNKINLLAEASAGVDEVRALQVQLKNAGFDPGPIDGIIGPRTRSALKRYRASHEFTEVTGSSAANGARMEY